MKEFREWLVGWTLREISDLFEGHGFTRAYVSDEELPGGQRRGLVECYYRNINVKIPYLIFELLLTAGVRSCYSAVVR